MSRRSSAVASEELHSRSLSRSSSVASSHLSRWSKPTTTTPTGSRRGSLESHEDGSAARDPLSGHFGHLTPEQEVKLEEFKEELSKRDAYSEGGAREEGGGKGRGRVDDSTLLRFLRARKFHVEGAVKQYTDFLTWRDDKGVDEAYENFDVEAYETLRRVYPMFVGRRDLRGLPIYVYKISALTPATLSRLIPNDAASSSSIAVITFALIRFLLPFTTAIQHPDQPMSVISGSNSIVDVGGVGLSRFWGLRSHLQVASQVASANFPETIDRVFVVGAPSFFPTVFNWAKKWFDPGTVDKIHILSHDTLPTLLTMMPKESIPIEYGGELDWTYGQDPNLDEEAKKALGGEWVRGPICWDSKQGRVKPVGKVGSVRRDEGYDDGSSEENVSGTSSPTRQMSETSVRGRTGQPPAASNAILTPIVTDEPTSSALRSSASSSSINSPSSPAHSSRRSSSSSTHRSSPRTPESRTIPPPTSRVIPGTHIPTHHSSLIPKGAYPDPAVANAIFTQSPTSSMSGRSGKSSIETHNEAVELGWVKGSGVGEDEFLSMNIKSLGLGNGGPVTA